MTTPLSLGAEIATYLQGVTSLGLNFSGPGPVNLFVNGIPDAQVTPDLAASVNEGGGIAPVMTLEGNSAGVNKVDRPVVQIRVRAPMGGFVAGNTLVNGIFSALQGNGNGALTSGGATFLLLMANQSPVYLDRDELQRHRWSQNYAIFWVNDQR